MDNLRKALVDYKISALRDLLAEIEAEGYTTVEQIKGAIHSDIDRTIIAALQIESEEYEAAAKADHRTENQF